MSKESRIAKADYEKLLQDFDKELDTAAKQIKGISDNLNALLKGNSDGPYWNGATAKTFYNKAKRNLDSDIAAYTSARKVFNKLKKKYVSLSQKGYFSND